MVGVAGELGMYWDGYEMWIATSAERALELQIEKNGIDEPTNGADNEFIALDPDEVVSMRKLGGRIVRKKIKTWIAEIAAEGLFAFSNQ